MTVTEQVITAEALLGNCESMRNIIREIVSKLNFQVLGNCEILEHLEIKTTGPTEVVIAEIDSRPSHSKETAVDGLPFRAFCPVRVEALIRSPLKLSIARINGLLKVVEQLERQARAITKVSTGK
jgi:hypothetical protein